MRLVKENYLSLIIIFLIFAMDRYSKNKIILLLENQNSLFINDYLNFNLVFNTGIGFGILSLNAGLFYNAISIIIFFVIFFLVIYMFKSKKMDKVLFSLIIGGALGNFYDRVFFKAVPDFIDLHFNGFHWFSFNVADIFISIGVLFMILNELAFKKNEN